MSIKTRTHKARLASEQVVISLNKSKTETHFGQRSLTDPAVNYSQIIKWQKPETLEDIRYSVVECECQEDACVGMEQPICKGNSNGTICYHCLAALIKKAADNGQTLSLFDHFSDASRYANFGGKLVKVVSTQGEGYCWAVAKKRESLQGRVDLMRGPVEEGID